MMTFNCQNASKQRPVFSTAATIQFMLVILATCCNGTAGDGVRSLHHLLPLTIDPKAISRHTRQITNAMMPGALQLGNPVQLALPNGFTPPIAPIKPMLYPFDHTSSTYRPKLVNSYSKETHETSSDWMPIVGDIIGGGIPKPSSTEVSNQDQEVLPPTSPHGYNDQALESIVYGNWKPEPPEEPLKKPKIQSSEVSNSAQRRRDSYSFSKEDYEIATPVSVEEYPSIENNTPAVDTYLRSKSKRVQNSATNRPARTNPRPPNPTRKSHRKTTIEDNFTTEIPAPQQYATEPPTPPQSVSTTTTTEQSSKNWPADFVYSNEEQPHLSEENTQASVETLPVTTTILPPYNYNITKMGVPYEDQNSAEEPTICVPLRMRERSLTSTAEMIDVERIYCFPLPHPTAAKSETTISLNDATGSWGTAQAVTNEPPSSQETTLRPAGTMFMDYAETDIPNGSKKAQTHTLSIALITLIIGACC